MNPSRTSRRRIAVLAAAVAVTGVTTTAVVAGTAFAAGTGTCTSTVKVRSEPSANAPVVGTCESGRNTRVGESKNGFVKLDEFGGWASAKYVSTSGAKPAANEPAGNEGGTGSLIGRGGSADRPAADRAATPQGTGGAQDAGGSQGAGDAQDAGGANN